MGLFRRIEEDLEEEINFDYLNKYLDDGERVEYAIDAIYKTDGIVKISFDTFLAQNPDDMQDLRASMTLLSWDYIRWSFSRRGCAAVAADGMVVGEDIFHVPIHMTAFHDDAVGNAGINTHGGADAVEGVALPDLMGVPLQRGAAAVNLQQRRSRFTEAAGRSAGKQ